MPPTIPIYSLHVRRDARWPLHTTHIRQPNDLAALLADYLADADREHLVVVTGDAHHRVTGLHTAAIGGLDRVDIHPREVFKIAVHIGAAAIWIAHNHPTGDPSPSAADDAATRRLQWAGAIVGIPVLDHVILGTSDVWLSYHQSVAWFRQPLTWEAEPIGSADPDA
jgi:DNA repair protein RadC